MTMIAEVHFASYPDELELLGPALERGDFGGRSVWVDEYEAALASHFRVARAVATSSGSAALHTALHVIGAVPGGTVVLPATAPVPTVLSVFAAGLEPLFVDVEPESFAFDPRDLERCVDERCVAAITVPMWGYPHDCAQAKEVLGGAGIALVEDAAHAHGSLLNGRPVGTAGDIGCFSTHQRKLLSTGEGGFLLTGDADLADRCKDFTVLGVGGLEPHAVNHKLTGIQALLGRHRLARLEERIELRRQVVGRLLDGIDGTPLTELATEGVDTRGNHYALALRLERGPDEVARVRGSLEAAGVPCEIRRFGSRPIYETEPFQRYRRACPNAERLLGSLLVVPCHEGLSDRDVAVMVDALRAPLCGS